MKARTLGAVLVSIVVGLSLAACGGSKDKPAYPASNQTPATTRQAGDTVSVKTADTPLGNILVGPNGLTLYGFTNDSAGQSSCTGTCAEAWPPLTVGSDWTVGPGLDSAVFNTVRRDDGTEQLVAGQFPLYYFSGDTAPGQTNGQGSGGVWFVVNSTDVTLIEQGAADDAADGDAEDAAVTVQVVDSDLGEILVDGEGRTLYGFTKDANGVPTCSGDCASTWPAFEIDGDPVLGEGLDPQAFTVVDGVEGGAQLKAGKWPLYFFSGDTEPGDINGQGTGGVWFVVRPDGSLAKDA
jgi:predicted lipoprotein with Yx(FWY)xxD motif